MFAATWPGASGVGFFLVAVFDPIVISFDLVVVRSVAASRIKVAFNEFSKKKLTKEKLPSVRKVLSAFKEQAKAISKSREVVKNKDRGIER